jgi:tRNA threonylcarbamoyladenosine biosynthesis protein TsaE
MNTNQSLEITSLNIEQTAQLAKAYSSCLSNGDIVILDSDVGGGKTTFISTLAAALGSNDIVSSPTFNILKLYNCSKGLRIYHFDFYRLGDDPGIVADYFADVLCESNYIILAEWANSIHAALKDRKTKHIKITKITDSSRLFSFTGLSKEQFSALKRHEYISKVEK